MTIRVEQLKKEVTARAVSSTVLARKAELRYGSWVIHDLESTCAIHVRCFEHASNTAYTLKQAATNRPVSPTSECRPSGCLFCYVENSENRHDHQSAFEAFDGLVYC